MPLVAWDVSSVAFVIYCMISKGIFHGAVAEQLPAADNYHGKILGGILTNLVLQAASMNCLSPYQRATIICDNQGVIYHGDYPTQSLKEKQAQVDILRIFKDIVSSHPFPIFYQWVKSHHDDKNDWEELTLVEQLNVLINWLAKEVLISAVEKNRFINNTFSGEKMKIYTDQGKITGLIRKAITHHWGRCMSHNILTEKDTIAKDSLHLLDKDLV